MASSEREPALPLGGSGQVFDPPGTLFNGAGPVRAPRTYVRRVPDEQQAPAVIPWSPTTRRDFVPTASDLSSAPVPVAAPEAPVAYESLAGNFSGVRAAQVLRQHQMGFWDAAGIVDQVMASTGSDPTQDQINQMYEDLRLFSYMPEGMLPTPAAFADQVTPSRRAAAARSALVVAGILTNNTWSTPQPADSPTPMITQSPPFADQLTNWCASRGAIQQTNWF